MSDSLLGSRMMPPLSDQDAELVATASRALAHAKRDALRVCLEDGAEYPLPRLITLLLSKILAEMALGNSVTIIPVHADLTTQESANLLNVSRPHLIKLLERNEMPFHMSGTHRRVKFTDLKAYLDRFAQQREAAQAELATLAQEMDPEPEPEH